MLWAIAHRARAGAQVGYAAIAGPARGDGGGRRRRRAALLHWLRSLVVLALLVVMIYKPGA